MANDKTIKLGIETALKGTGLKEAEEGLDKVTDAADGAADALDDAGKEGKKTEGKLDGLDDKAKDTTRTIAKMEDELRDLEAALKRIDPASADFEKTAVRVGSVRKEIQIAGDRADEFARKSGGAAAGTRNLGGAFLELSRGVEDAQYGLGGVVNNLPNMIAMFGGSAGLAAVVSLAAVGLNLFVKNLDKAKDEAGKKEEFEEMEEVIKKLGARFKEFYEGREGRKNTLADTVEKETAAIGRQTAEIERNIGKMKEQIELIGALRDAGLRNQIEVIKGQEQRGEITPEKSREEQQRLEEQLRKDGIERLKVLGKLDTELFEAKKAAAEQELAVAKSALEAADRQTEQVNRLKATVDKLAAAISAAEQLQALQGAGGREAGKTFEPVMDIEARRRKMDELEKTMPGVGLPGSAGSNPQTMELLKDRLAEAEKELTKLGPNVEGVSEAVKAANDKLEEATRNLQDAQDRGAGDESKRDVEGLGDALERSQQDWEMAGDEAGRKISEIFEKWVGALGKDAEGGKAAELIEMVRGKLADGIQEGELAQILATANSIAASVNKVTSTSAQAFGSMQSAISSQQAQMGAIARKLKELEAAVKQGGKEAK